MDDLAVPLQNELYMYIYIGHHMTSQQSSWWRLIVHVRQPGAFI